MCTCAEFCNIGFYNMITSVLDVCWFLFVRRLSLCLLRCRSPLMCVSASVCEMLSRMWNAKMSGMRTERGLSSEVC